MADSDIAMRHDDILRIRKEAEELFQGLKQSQRKELDLDEIRELIRAFELALDEFRIELKMLAPGSKKNKYRKDQRDHKDALNRLKAEVETASANQIHDKLLDGADVDVKLDSAEGLMAHGLKVTDESTDILRKTAGVVAETQVIGRQTANKLNQQTEQNMYDELDSIEGTLNRSVAVIKRMTRTMATDRYLWVVTFLVVVAVVIIIIVKA